jgi:hypothetical protein
MNLTNFIMKKIVTAGIVMILASVILTGCILFQPPQEEVKEETKDTQVMTEPYTYEDKKLGFSLTFLPSWGKVTKELYGDQMFVLFSEDGEKRMNLFAISKDETGDAAVVDTPAEKIGETAYYDIYREVNQGIDILDAQGEDMTEEKALRDEIIEIAQTFKTLDEGEKDPSLYKNSRYGFSLNFPITWGEVTSQELPGDEIIVSSPIDADRNFTIIMVGIDYKDTVKDIEGTEHVYFGENDELAFYARLQSCLGGPGCDEEKEDMVGEEVEDIAETFKLI